MLMLSFGCACAASLDAPSSGMNESEKSCVPSLLRVHVFNPLVHVSNLHMPSTRWRSCHHKRHRHLILNWFRAGGNDLIGLPHC